MKNIFDNPLVEMQASKPPRENRNNENRPQL